MKGYCQSACSAGYLELRSLVFADVVTLRVAVLAVGIRVRYLAISGEDS